LSSCSKRARSASSPADAAGDDAVADTGLLLLCNAAEGARSALEPERSDGARALGPLLTVGDGGTVANDEVDADAALRSCACGAQLGPSAAPGSDGSSSPDGAARGSTSCEPMPVARPMTTRPLPPLDVPEPKKAPSFLLSDSLGLK